MIRIREDMAAEDVAKILCDKARSGGVPVGHVFQGTLMQARPFADPVDVLLTWQLAALQDWVLIGRRMKTLREEGINAAIGIHGGQWFVEVDGVRRGPEPDKGLELSEFARLMVEFDRLSTSKLTQK